MCDTNKQLILNIILSLNAWEHHVTFMYEKQTMMYIDQRNCILDWNPWKAVSENKSCIYKVYWKAF